LRTPGVIRPSLDLSILSRGVTSLVVYLSSVCWSLPARGSVDEPLGAAVPPPQAARDTAMTTATGTVVSHFKALIFIAHHFHWEKRGRAVKPSLAGIRRCRGR